MISIFDHLSALLIASAVILILMATQFRTTHAGVEQVATHSVKAKTLVFGNWIERDILDLGKNMGLNRYRFEEPVTDSLGNTGEFHFYSDSTCSFGCSFPGGVNIAVGDTARLHTRYRLTPTERVELAAPGGGGASSFSLAAAGFASDWESRASPPRQQRQGWTLGSAQRCGSGRWTASTRPARHPGGCPERPRARACRCSLSLPKMSNPRNQIILRIYMGRRPRRLVCGGPSGPRASETPPQPYHATIHVC